jgi:hypothetical protein
MWYTFWFSFAENRPPGVAGTQDFPMKKLFKKARSALVVARTVVTVIRIVPLFMRYEPEDSGLL